MRNRFGRMLAAPFIPALLGLLITAPLSLLYAQGPPGGLRIIEQGQPPVAIHATVGDIERAHGHGPGGGSSGNNLYYHGGIGGIGVETAPKIYLVLWGSQWSSDPSGEAALLTRFLSGVGGSSWNNSVTQYCQG